MPALLSIAVPAIGAINASAAGAGAMVAVPIGFEMLAIVVSSISGALTAREKRLDLVGAIALAVLCSLGGGLIRDVILQVGSVYIISQPLALPASMITAAVVFVIPSFVERQDRLIAVLDIFGVGLFAATGADKAYAYGFEPIICVMMGFFTAVGGGMLRDICLGQTPAIFQRSNFYAVAAVGGAMLAVAAATFGIAAAYGATASPASDGPLYNLPQGYRQEIVVDRSNRAYVLVESRSGGVAVVPYLDEDGGQVIIPQE